MKLADDVYRIGLPRSSAYLILGTRNVLIDTGIPGHGEELIGELNRILPDDHALDVVLLTHHDVDHIGNLVEVQKRYSVDVFINGEDLPYAEGKRHRPGIKRIIEKVLRPQIPEGLRPLAAYSDSGIRVIPLPGHTPGHTIFGFRGFLFTGDLFHTENGHITPTRKIMNWDNHILSDSIGSLIAMEAELLCPAHGNPVPFSKAIKEELRKVGDFYAGK